MARNAATWMVLTQFALVGTQLLLLPLEVRIWGAHVTAQWNTAIAVTSLLYAADLGLKGFGHTALASAVRSGLHPSESFAAIWAAIRLLIAGIALVAASAAWAASTFSSHPTPAWMVWLVLAFAAEGLLNARTTYMDTLGLMADGERCYAFTVWLRLLGALVALVVFRAAPPTLALIYAGSALAGLIAQSRAVRAYPAVRLAAGGFRSIGNETLGLLKYSAGYPLATWCRISLPVLVLNAVAPAPLINSYVALRALFGFVRAAVAHVVRHVSVQFSGAWRSSLSLQRERLQGWSVVCVVIGTAFALGVVLDGGSLVARWVPGASEHGYQWVSLSFSLLAPFFACDVLLFASTRDGGEIRAAGMQLLYVGLAFLAALTGLLTQSLGVYLGAWLVLELAYAGAVIVITRGHGVAMPFLRSAVCGTFLVFLCFVAVQSTDALNPGQGFSNFAMRAAVFVVLLGFMLMPLNGFVRRMKRRSVDQM